MSEPILTLTGNVATEPKQNKTRFGADMTSFRLASTPRRFDKDSNTWKDGTTIFIGVACYGALALNVSQSLKKGDAVVVSGRFQARTWVNEEAVQVTNEIVANTVGHDLNRGVTTLSKINRARGVALAVDEEGMPPDPSEYREELEAGDYEVLDDAEVEAAIEATVALQTASAGGVRR